MSKSYKNQLVFTVKDRCRVCYTCVRECPVKAIRIVNGQAEVMSERCIGCGNCVRVCSQGAKIFLHSQAEVKELLEGSDPVAALIAPSFPAEFEEISDYHLFIGMVRALGFEYVCEVGFGADMVARRYAEIMNKPTDKGIITSDCPSVTFYIRHYYPHLVDRLAPIVSPMVALNRCVKAEYGENIKTVFIGPCIAKKAESSEVDEALTFTELREMFYEYDITPQNASPSEFDPPYAGKGAIFPVSRGLLQTTNIREDVTERNIIIAEGSPSFKEAVREFDDGLVSTHHLELLCCKGCIMGAGMGKNGKRYVRRTLVANYVKQKLNQTSQQKREYYVKKFDQLDFSAHFTPEDRRKPLPTKEQIEEALVKIGKLSPQDYLNCGACGYDTCEEHAIAIAQGFAEPEMCLPYTIEKLHKSINDLNITNEKLAHAKAALKQSEKLAHMGQLSAGIAHELNNPLGVITMYANIMMEERPENDPLRKDLELIVEQANRCKKIVSGLLNFARKNQVNLTETHLEQLVQRSLDSVVKPDNVKTRMISEMKDPICFLDQEQMMQVLTNLEKNAIEAMPPEGGEITVTLKDNLHEVIIKVADTGIGIEKENMDKLFTPFYTTKELGKGTGLGLPLIYGIVKMHKGQISVMSNNNKEEGPTGTIFTITLPRNPNSV
ncbi:MAG TPA: [Fe-Fe] hydrogenase large subunit C-terminal domain-containing protein [Bacteroidales bacterium]|nr:4Fe-4S binding protein [Bacteroidales bacterium]MDI9574568.1 [Fe-Fe] hydrogenase large subunit C-terminal domain-containing protein [Bacteroidota bacterium]OQC61509.1 MAG: Sensor protein ZraS [Bacteroidetes bacterium ADurb.Bin012]MBP9512009.1 4Fe-4S binding protein [Bacteroidales bacterium]MBP9588628.1 4Fe-4S binding protein [Bacteroidales bacterium]